MSEAAIKERGEEWKREREREREEIERERETEREEEIEGKVLEGIS